MQKESPYEYFDGKLGVQGRFLFEGNNEHPDSLRLITIRGLQKKTEREQITKIRLQGPGTPMLVLFDSLPQAWQEAIVARWGEATKLIQKSMFEKAYVRDMEAFHFYSSYKFDDGTFLTRENIEQYTINASVLNVLPRIYNERRNYRKQLTGSAIPIQRGKRVSTWESVAAECRGMREQLEHDLPDNDRRLREKLNDYRKNGYESLIHKGHGHSNALKVDEDHMELLNSLFAGIDYKPTYAEVAKMYEGFLNGYVEVINENSGELYNPKDYRKLSVATVWNHLSKWENKIGTFLYRSGDRQKWMQMFKPYHNLNVQEKAGAIMSIDDREVPFAYNANKDRVVFYCGVDVGSETFTAWTYGKDKKGIIVDFYRNCVRNYAMWGLKLPYELECESNLNASYKDTLLKEGNMFERVRIEANNARGKVVEQYWRKLRYGCEKRDLGWLARPFALGEANQKRSDKTIIIPYDEIVEKSLLHIQDWNNMEHSKIKGMSRYDVFLSTQHPGLMPINWHGILPYIGFETRSSVHAGMINFRQEKFLLGLDGVISTGDRLINIMRQVEGRDILIRWLDDYKGDILKAFIYIDERFVCEAIPQPAYHRGHIDQDEHDLINRELMSKYVMTIDSYAGRKKKGIDKVTVINNIPVTIGNSFKINLGTERYTPGEQAKVLVDAVDSSININLNAIERSFNKNLAETF